MRNIFFIAICLISSTLFSSEKSIDVNSSKLWNSALKASIAFGSVWFIGECASKYKNSSNSRGLNFTNIMVAGLVSAGLMSYETGSTEIIKKQLAVSGLLFALEAGVKYATPNYLQSLNFNEFKNIPK